MRRRFGHTQILRAYLEIGKRFTLLVTLQSTSKNRDPLVDRGLVAIFSIYSASVSFRRHRRRKISQTMVVH